MVQLLRLINNPRTKLIDKISIRRSFMIFVRPASVYYTSTINDNPYE